MSNVLPLKIKAEPQLKVTLRHNDFLDSDLPFVDFGSDSLSVNAANGNLLFSILRADILEERTLMRDSVITENNVPYLFRRPALFDLSKRRVTLSPTLLRHLAGYKQIMIIDEIVLQSPHDDIDGHIAVLQEIRRVYGKTSLVIMLDWHYMMQQLSDFRLPSPDYMANISGFINTGLFWISKPEY